MIPYRFLYSLLFPTYVLPVIFHLYSFSFSADWDSYVRTGAGAATLHPKMKVMSSGGQSSALCPATRWDLVYAIVIWSLFGALLECLSLHSKTVSLVLHSNGIYSGRPPKFHLLHPYASQNWSLVSQCSLYFESVMGFFQHL